VIEGELTPRQIVEELDKYIVGQNDAKRAVAIALRNRARRRAIAEELRNEIIPKNILMIGPTGVGKTEIARRLANLANAPFIKVEATKFTEVGYVGRDVDSMVRDLVETAYRMVEDEFFDDVWEEAEHRADERLLDILAGRGAQRHTPPPVPQLSLTAPEDADLDAEREEALRHAKQIQQQEERVRDFTRRRLESGELEDQEIEIDNEIIDQEEAVATAEVHAILEKVLELGDGDLVVGTIKAVEAGVLDSPMSINIHAQDKVLGIRDNTGACRYLEFGHLPIPEDIKDFHRQKVAEREKAEGRRLDYYASIEDFWGISKSRLKGLPADNSSLGGGQQAC